MALFDILEAIVEAVATADGQTPYTHDLSGDDAVRMGRRKQAGGRVEVHLYNPAEQFTREGQPLGLVRANGSCVLDGHLGSQDYDPPARYQLATTLKDDMIRALLSSFDEEGVFELEATGAVMEAEDGTPFARVNVTWWTRSTTGV